QIVGHVGKLETERLLHHGLVGRALAFRVRRRLLLAVLEPAERDGLDLFLALADDDHRRLLADRRVGDDAWQVAPSLDALAVDLNDHVARWDAGGLARPSLVPPGNQRAARRIDLQAVRDLVGDLLDAHAEPAAPGLAELLELLDHRHGGFRRHRKAD